MFRRKRKVTMTWPPPEERVHLDLDKIEASRAIFQGAADLPRVRVAMTTTTGQVVDFEMDLAQTARLIEQATYAFRASVPTPKTQTQTYGL